MPPDTELTYGRHLKLDSLLNAQRPVSSSPDEVMFIIQHQTSELWMSLILHELDMARDALGRDDFRAAQKALGRVVVVFEQLVKSWDVLRTLTPQDFAAFRGELGTASGFQSYQYRLIEFVIGNRVPAHLGHHAATPEIHDRLVAELQRPSLYQVTLQRLQTALGLTFSDGVFRLDCPYEADAQVEDAWARVYADPDGFPGLLALAERLVQLEDIIRCWRFNHVTTVERVIGMKRGTGGTSGVGYLRRMLEVEHFPELWRLRASL